MFFFNFRNRKKKLLESSLVKKKVIFKNRNQGHLISCWQYKLQPTQESQILTTMGGMITCFDWLRKDKKVEIVKNKPDDDVLIIKY